jgi:Protein of unknown function (DUF2589)
VAGPVSLHDLIEAIANAVIEAQDRIERHQISNVSRFFDQDDRPVSVALRLPNPSLQAAEGEDVVLRVPLLALVHSNLLKIKDVEVSFDVDLSDFSVPEAPARLPGAEKTGPDASGASAVNGNASAEAAWDGKEPAKMLQVDMRSSVVRERGATARIVMRVEGQGPTEGMSRLVHHLIKTM